ncbi:putative bifunctional diguanylate cyclase/phosphodiesterase [Candidatus Magnetobacterium casense]|uniref:EAL domain-containing protein n=1 Tax=Candidatus Magnetobacterium casense TaxID=1455061 RepID=A0ABS6S096_9BACT|nr:bifunctional diguanylate cyclase/phosphodiesterase [Candidatus Magnetobacterium casensis]MBV6341813.1 EAL domain-containing protein [Candidatus Magnetobacterium casensis]
MTIKRFIIGRLSIVFAIYTLYISFSIFYNFHRLTMQTIREKSLITASTIKAGLTAHMNSGTMDKKDYFLQEISYLKGIDKLWITRVQDIGLGDVKNVSLDSIDEVAIKTNKPQFIDYKVNDTQRFRVAVPYIASNTGNLKCLNCHHVMADTTIGILNMEMDISEFRDSNVQFIVFTIVSLLVAAILTTMILISALQRTVARPLRALIGMFAEAVREYKEIDPEEFELQEHRSIIKEMNHILYEIKDRDDDIRTLNTFLENAVTQRTQELQQKAITDSLTGLYNRNRLIEDLQKNVDAEKSVLLINIDDFSQINNVYGMRIGDMVLKLVADILKKLTPDNASLYRISGDEFLMMLISPQGNQPRQLANTLKDYVNNNNINIVGEELYIKITFTIGLDTNVDGVVVRHATVAVMEAREHGKNRVQVYSPDSQTEQRYKNNLYWANELKKAIERQDIIPYFQAIIDNSTGKPGKFEALVRMKDSTGAIISPIYFLEPARKTGIFTSITKVMIDKSMEYFKDKPYEFSINITDFDFKEGFLLDYLEQRLRQHNIPPSRVVLEILEGISMKGTKDTIDQIDELSAMGFKIAIDDFGTEYSNFSRLLELHADYIKIDGSFIKGLVTDKNSRKIVKSITDFAHSIDTKVIAEYVHNKEVQEIVLELGIDYSQGYYFSEPVRDITKITTK